MAEAIVNIVIEKTVSLFADKLLKPVCSLLVRSPPLEEVHSKINLIKSELEIMKTYLRYVDTKMDSNEQLGAWVKLLREVVYEVEDIIDEYTYLVGEQQRHGFWSFLYRTIRHYKNVKAWNDLSSHLTEVNTRLVNLSRQKERYGITDEIRSIAPDAEASEQDRQLAEASHFLHEDEIVGFKTYKNLLVGWLTDEEPARTLISVWGMGGVGKTTLVTDVYKSQVVKRHFDCRAWVYVSQMYTTEELLRRIIKEFYEENDESLPSGVNEMSLRRLVGTLQNYLRDKRYLIVLDNVWHSKTSFEISAAFIDCNCGNRIVLTTRIHDVALLAVETRVLELQPLGKDYSWLLFCNKAFWKEKDKSCPKDVEYWAWKIVERCQGLPLAIVAIGSLLSMREKTELEWRKVFEYLNWEDPNLPMIHRVQMILKLSFKDLPYYLRSCFMYCCIFPEDYPIKRKRIIRLWVAEGFIEQRRKRTMEEAAEDCLNELVHRCMLQVVKRNHFGRVKLFRMHDLMRDLTKTISESENFCMFMMVKKLA